MSINLIHYFGIGYELDYSKYTEKASAFLEKHPEYSPYRFENPNVDKPGLQILIDHMHGNYIYLIYVLKRVEEEEMYSRDTSKSIRIVGLDESIYIDKVFKLYHDIFDEWYDNDDGPCLISFFHCL